MRGWVCKCVCVNGRYTAQRNYSGNPPAILQNTEPNPTYLPISSRTQITTTPPSPSRARPSTQPSHANPLLRTSCLPRSPRITFPVALRALFFPGGPQYQYTLSYTAPRTPRSGYTDVCWGRTIGWVNEGVQGLERGGMRAAGRERAGMGFG